MADVPRVISKLDKKQIQKDLKRYQQLALELGTTDVQIIKSNNLVVQERIRSKCIIPKCAEYGTNLHCPPYSLTAKEIKEVLQDYKYGLAIKIDIDPKYAAGADIQKCYLRGELDESGRYKALGKQYKKMFFIVSEIESKAFYDGYHLAMGFAAGSCKNVFCFKLDCQGLQPGKGCRNPLRARPSMEAVGFDVFGMSRDLGWRMYPIGGKTEPCDVPHASLQGSGKRIVDFQEGEFQEIPVSGIERFHAMLPQDRGKVCVRNKVAAGWSSCTQLPIYVPEPFSLRKEAHLRQAQKRCDVCRCLIRCQGVVEHRRVRCDANVAHRIEGETHRRCEVFFAGDRCSIAS